MNYQFSAASEALQQAGKLVQCKTADGTLLPMLRDATTGHIVEIAKAATGLSLQSAFQSIAAPAHSIVGPIQMLQTHLGFQKTYQMLGTLQSNVAVLHVTTAVIGVGTFAGAALSGVNLYQSLKLRKDLKKIAKNIQEITMNQDVILKNLSQSSEDIKSRIDRVAEDVEFKSHKTILDLAYGQFSQAINEMQNVLEIENPQKRSGPLAQINGTFMKALADYRNTQIYTNNTNAPARLRRYECAWQIEQGIAIIYVLDNEFGAANKKMEQLKQNIFKDTIDVLSHCKTEAELDFLYPELMRIYTRDIPVIEGWHAQVKYLENASEQEREEITNIKTTEEVICNDVEIFPEDDCKEQMEYEALKQSSHFTALRDFLRFTVDPQARREYEAYISKQGPKHGYHALSPSNWQEVPDMTVANLYWYLKSKDNELSQLSIE